MEGVIWTDAVGQAELVRQGDISATELLEAHLDRIDRFDPLLRAFVSMDEPRVRAEARAVDDTVAAGRQDGLGPFGGVTISIKDVIDVAGLATTHSCKVLADHVAVEDAPLVGRLRDAGFLVLGKTNVPEFCTSVTASELHGTCRNPWDPARTPAGSSGGAAVSVAAGLCAVAHGTDGAGSVRVPAAYCGLVGTKPTRGRVSDGPELDNPYYGTSVDGILSRSVRDAAAVLDVVAPGPEALAAELTTAPGPLRIAVTVDPPYGDVNDECAPAALAAAELLASFGHAVTEATPAWATILEAAMGPMTSPGPAGLVPIELIDRLEPRNRPLLEQGHRLTVVEHARWVDLVRARALEFLTFWDEVDVLVTPTSGVLPPPVDFVSWDLPRDEHSARFLAFPLPAFAQPFNLSGQPALSLPLATSTGGLPIGVQLVGRRGAELTLLRLAQQVAEAQPWDERHPDDGVLGGAP